MLYWFCSKLLAETIYSKLHVINERICVLCLKGKFFNLLIHVHATTDVIVNEKKSFEDLESVYNVIPRYYSKIVLGDFNARIGKEKRHGPTIGHYKHKTTNDNGNRLIDFVGGRRFQHELLAVVHKILAVFTASVSAIAKLPVWILPKMFN